MRIIYLLMLIFPLSLFSQNRYAVVIDEIMADPTPPVGLPGNEWIELKNRTALPINLQGWRVTDASGQSGPMPSFVLLPDSFVVVCATSAFGALSSFGTTISVTNFPSLDNAGDQLALKTASGRTVHAVEYDDSWYQNELKKEGGWTLEMMDPGNPCAAATNWKASVHAAGGTPGHRNSVDGIVDDRDGPNLTRTWTVDSITIVAVFDEPVDSLTAASHSNYAIDGGLMVTVATPLPPLFNQVELKLSAQM